MCSKVFYRNAKGKLNQMISDYSSLISKISPTPFEKGEGTGALKGLKDLFLSGHIVKHYNAKEQGDNPQRVAECALLNWMEMGFGAFVAMTANIQWSYAARLFVHGFYSFYRGAAGCAFFVRLVAGQP